MCCCPDSHMLWVCKTGSRLCKSHFIIVLGRVFFGSDVNVIGLYASDSLSILRVAPGVRFFHACLSVAPKRFESEILLCLCCQWDRDSVEIVNWKEKPHESLSLHLLHCNLINRTCWTWRERGATQPYCVSFPRGRQEICCGMYLRCVRVSLPLSLSLSLSLSGTTSVTLPLFSALFLSSFPLDLFCASRIFLSVSLVVSVFVSLSLTSSLSLSVSVFVLFFYKASVCLYIHNRIHRYMNMQETRKKG